MAAKAVREPAERRDGEDSADRNEVVLRGRLAAQPELRRLPSGDEVAAWRMVVRRDQQDIPARPDGRRVAVVDTLDCAAWRPALRRQVGRWQTGDVVEVEGVVRRRFFRAAGAAASRWEIVARQVRRVSRASA